MRTRFRTATLATVLLAGTAAVAYAQGPGPYSYPQGPGPYYGYNSPGTNTMGAPGSIAGGRSAVVNQTDTNTMGGHEPMGNERFAVEPGSGPTPQESGSSQLPTGGPKPH
jgi:hypothetical protein